MPPLWRRLAGDMHSPKSIGPLLLAAALTAFVCAAVTQPSPAPASFSFVVAGDMRNFTHSTNSDEREFDGACEAIQQAGPGEFMILPGDFDPPQAVRATIDQSLGTNYFCYFVVGDHEQHTPAVMDWFRHWGGGDLPHLVRRGPPGAESTMYTFDFANSHFVALSDFFDGTNDAAKPNLADATLAWLEQDLAANHQPLVWVISHKPLECLPDMDSGRQRHKGDSCVLDPVRREKFADLLKKYHTRALLCGHTHGCSVEKVHGVWQADSGHARGAGDPGAPSTFLKIRVSGEQTWVDIYRADPKGKNYQLRKTVELN
jgi:Calcineurin-like phosphoesterase